MEKTISQDIKNIDMLNNTEQDNISIDDNLNNNLTCENTKSLFSDNGTTREVYLENCTTINNKNYNLLLQSLYNEMTSDDNEYETYDECASGSLYESNNYINSNNIHMKNKHKMRRKHENKKQYTSYKTENIGININYISTIPQRKNKNK